MVTYKIIGMVAHYNMKLDGETLKKYMPFAVVGTIVGVLAFANNQNKQAQTSTVAADQAGNISEANLEGFLQSQSQDYNNSLQAMTNQVNAALAQDSGQLAGFQASLSSQDNNINTLTGKVDKANSQYSDLYNKITSLQNATSHPTSTVAQTAAAPRPAPAPKSSAPISGTFGAGSGDRNAVTLIQHQLENRGYSTAGTGTYIISNKNWDGIFGQGTTSAVKQFQIDHHLQADGVVGAQTIAALWG